MNENQDQVKVVTPGAGAYMNEGIFVNPDWKKDYYGAIHDGTGSLPHVENTEFLLDCHTHLCNLLVHISCSFKLAARRERGHQGSKWN